MRRLSSGPKRRRTRQCIQSEQAGRHVSDSKGVAQDYKEAAKWYRKAAEQGNPDGQTNLGGLTRMVKVSPRITRKPLSGTEKLLNKAMRRAQRPSWRYVQNGKGVPQDLQGSGEMVSKVR